MGILNLTFKFEAHFRVLRSEQTFPFGALCMVRTPCLFEVWILSSAELEDTIQPNAVLPLTTERINSSVVNTWNQHWHGSSESAGICLEECCSCLQLQKYENRPQISTAPLGAKRDFEVLTYVLDNSTQIKWLKAVIGLLELSEIGPILISQTRDSGKM